MLNQTVIVGRLVRDPDLYETENGNKEKCIRDRFQTKK